MLRLMLCTALLSSSAPTLAQKTDWGVRAAPGSGSEPFLVPPKTAYIDPSLAPLPGKPLVGFAIRDIVRIGAQWGRVTSTARSVEHNRRVGGVANSYHLSGRAIDIARRPGVRHAQIAAALRNAGYHLLESLDEGDHSHFAFGAAGEIKLRDIRPRAQMVDASGRTHWRIVFAPAGSNR